MSVLTTGSKVEWQVYQFQEKFIATNWNYGVILIRDLHSGGLKGRHGQTSLNHSLINGTRSQPRKIISNGDSPKCVSYSGIPVEATIVIVLERATTVITEISFKFEFWRPKMKSGHILEQNWPSKN